LVSLSHPALGFVVVVGSLFVRLLPIKLASALMAWLVLQLSKMFFNRKVIGRNIRDAFPELDEAERDRLVTEIIQNAGRLVAEVAKIRCFVDGTQGAHLRAKGAFDYPLVQKGRAIYIGAHLGNWELMPILFSKHGVPLTIIYSAFSHQAVETRLMAARRQTGSRYVEKGNALRGCIDALKRGESIAMLVDQRVDAGIEVEFFGRPTMFTHFPARMACKFNCPIIVGEAIRVGPAEVEVTFSEPIYPNSQGGAEAERELTQAMVSTIESAIRRHPEQWFCNKRRWKRLKGEDSGVVPAEAAPVAEAVAEATPTGAGPGESTFVSRG